MDEGSLRGVVLLWVRMTLGIGILTLPYFFKIFGANLAVIILISAAYINYLTSVFILEASYFTGK